MNQAVRRETLLILFSMMSVNESLAKLGKSTIFTKLEANSSFWQLPLCEESKLLTTFIMPFSRFAFNRLPFGISSVPEIFQRHMSQMLEDMEGVVCHMDDILVHGTDQTQHDARVRAVLQRLQAAGLTLNNKCEFSKTSIKFLGNIIDAPGIYVDSSKTAAIAHFPAPTNIAEFQRFVGMVNQMGKVIPRLAEINKPLRQLLCKDTAWLWEASQETAFQQVKDVLDPRYLHITIQIAQQ